MGFLSATIDVVMKNLMELNGINKTLYISIFLNNIHIFLNNIHI
jgi:hypothetical protein